MRRARFILMALAVLALPASVIVGNVMSARTLADLTARPVTALIRADGAALPVAPSGQVATPTEARWMGASGTFLGYRISFLMPDGAIVTCQASGTSIRCDDGWTVERTHP